MRASTTQCRSPSAACARRCSAHSSGPWESRVSACRQVRARRASGNPQMKVERVRASKLRTRRVARCAGRHIFGTPARTDIEIGCTFTSSENYVRPFRAQTVHETDTNAQHWTGTPGAGHLVALSQQTEPQPLHFGLCILLRTAPALSALADGEWVVGKN